MKNFERLPSEGPKAFAAFMSYCEMGPKRSLSKVAKNLGKDKSLLSRWSSQYGWVERSLSYDMHFHEVRMKEREQDIIENEKLVEEIGKKFVEKAVEGLEDIDASKLKVSERIKMIDIGSKIKREASKALFEHEKNKVTKEQNKIIFEVIDSKGRKHNLSKPEENE